MSVEGAGEVAFVAAGRFSLGFSFGDAAGDVFLGLGVDPFAGEDDRVEGSVEFAVAAAVESVADGLSA